MKITASQLRSIIREELEQAAGKTPKPPARGTYTFTDRGKTYTVRGVVRVAVATGSPAFFPDPADLPVLVGLGYDDEAIDEDGLDLTAGTFTPGGR